MGSRAQLGITAAAMVALGGFSLTECAPKPANTQGLWAGRRKLPVTLLCCSSKLGLKPDWSRAEAALQLSPPKSARDSGSCNEGRGGGEGHAAEHGGEGGV